MPRFRPLTLAATAAVAIGAILALIYVMRSGPVHAPDSLVRFTLTQHPAPLPGVAFADISGKRHTLAEYKGRYVLLNLWATWCAPCVKELPSLAKLQQAMGGQLTVVTVDVGRGDTSEAAQFMKAHGAGTLPVYLDSDIALVRALKAYGLPVSVLVDPKGREIGRAAGDAEWADPEAIKYLQAITARASS